MVIGSNLFSGTPCKKSSLQHVTQPTSNKTCFDTNNKKEGQLLMKNLPEYCFSSIEQYINRGKRKGVPLIANISTQERTNKQFYSVQKKPATNTAQCSSELD